MKTPSMDMKTAQGRNREVAATVDGVGESVMTTAITTMNTEQTLLKAVPAANADRLTEAVQAQEAAFENAGAWDSYEVWRRFFKDARARRERTPS